MQRLVNQLPQSSHFQFLSTKPFAAVGDDIEDLNKLTVMWSLNKRFLVGNVGIASIPCRLSCQILVNFFWICVPNDCI